MIEIILSSFLIIFIAEMGDKTQLMAMAFTAKFKPLNVILAISVATILNNLIAVVAGSLLSGLLPVSAIKIASYILFILFGLWTIYGEKVEKEKESDKFLINPFFTVAILFFISEFGDKTQIAAMTLAMNQTPLYVLIGASAGMIAANLIGIGVGMLMSKKVPAHIIKWFSAGLFIVIGLAGFTVFFFGSFNIANAVLAESAMLFVTLSAIFIILKIGNNK